MPSQDNSLYEKSQGVKWGIADKSYRFQLGIQVFMPYLALLLRYAVGWPLYNAIGCLPYGHRNCIWDRKARSAR